MSEFAHAQGLMIASNEYSGKTGWGPDSQTDKKKITRGTFMCHSMQRIDRPMALCGRCSTAVTELVIVYAFLWPD